MTGQQHSAAEGGWLRRDEDPAVDDAGSPRAAALAATVVADGELTFRRDATGNLIAIDGSDSARRVEWLDAVYSDTALITQLGQIDPGSTLAPVS